MRKQSMLSPDVSALVISMLFSLAREGVLVAPPTSQTFRYFGEWSCLMNRFVTLLALAIGVSGPASAGAISPYRAPLGVNNTDVLAGQVSLDGVIERGFGFRVHRNADDSYTIKFDRRTRLACRYMPYSPFRAFWRMVKLRRR